MTSIKTWWRHRLFHRIIAQQVTCFNLSPGQNGLHFADDVFKCISLNKNFWIRNKISLKCVPYCLVDSLTALVQIMAYLKQWWYVLLTHICVTLPQWVKAVWGAVIYIELIIHNSLHTIHCRFITSDLYNQNLYLCSGDSSPMVAIAPIPCPCRFDNLFF